MSWRTPTKEQASAPKRFETPRIVKLIVLWVSIFAAVLAVMGAIAIVGNRETPSSRFRAPSTAPLSPQNYDAPWPFTIPDGELRCEPVVIDGVDSDLQIVTLAYQGVTYAVNGIARGRMTARGWHDIGESWKDNPDIPGAKVPIGSVIDRGRALCPRATR